MRIAPEGVSTKILIIEDSKIVTARLMELLAEIPGVEVAGAATDVRAAGTLIRLLTPDVLLLDLQVDGETTLEVLRSIKSNWRDVAAIVWTNSPSAFAREACFKAGADFFLDKSNDVAELQSILTKMSKTPRLACAADAAGQTKAAPRKAS